VKVPSRLRETDDRYVPRMAATLRTTVDAAEERRRQAGERTRAAGQALMDRRGPLRRLDDRYASSGPLALLREVPQLGLLLVAAIFVTGAGVALARSGGEQRAVAQQRQIDASTPTALGPDVGTSIDAYIAQAKKRAAIVSQGSPDGVYTAFVSFSTYLTPQRAQLALGELQVTKVILHAHLPTADVLPVSVTQMVPDVKKVSEDVVRRKIQDATEFEKLARSITPKSKEEQQFQSFYLAAAKQARAEAAAYKGDCPCVIGVLVRGQARELAALPAIAGIRVVELGGRQDDDALLVRPLDPAQTGIVKKIATPTGGNGA
jgi:hypothetical protein